MKARAPATRRASFRAAASAYWTDGNEERILYVTSAISCCRWTPRPACPIPSFGDNGVVDLKLE